MAEGWKSNILQSHCMVKWLKAWYWGKTGCIQILPPTVFIFVALNKLVNISVPQFSHLENRLNNDTPLIKSL